ncbi:hypothetical protein [Pseudolysinimonas sp.]|uniref:hypothetical protein n=1 Tax=Pseudolysinimonas sp. TaxID=2680009 RepID=UPI003F8146BB
MELLFVLVIAAGIGGLVRYALPGRHSYGLFLLPAVGVVVAAVVWEGLTWLGWKYDGGWIWVVALGVTLLACVAVWLAVWQGRTRGDQRLLHELSRGRA